MTLLTANLISLSELIAQANRKGVDFDGANPKEHIFYLSKIGLLPKAVKRTNAFGKLEAHYQPSVVDLLTRIYSLKRSGLAYSQIGKFSSLNTNHALPETQQVSDSVRQAESFPANHFPGGQHSGSVAGLSNQTIVFLFIGLILGYLINANNNIRNNSVSGIAAIKDSQPTVTASQVNPSSQLLFRLLTSPDTANNNDLYLITLPKSNFSKLEKVRITDLANTDSIQSK